MGPSGHSRISPGRVEQMQPSLFQSCCQLATVGHGGAGEASHTGSVTEEHLLPLSVERDTSREGSQAQAKVGKAGKPYREDCSSPPTTGILQEDFSLAV